jgi:hypothetical protein
MYAPTHHSRRSRASTARDPDWQPQSGSFPGSAPMSCGTVPASDPRLATPAAHRLHCSDRSDRWLTSTPRAQDRWPPALLAAHGAWSVCVVLVWRCNAMGSPDGQPRINNNAFKRTPEGDLRSKVLLGERHPGIDYPAPITRVEPVSQLFAADNGRSSLSTRSPPMRTVHSCDVISPRQLASLVQRRPEPPRASTG